MSGAISNPDLCSSQIFGSCCPPLFKILRTLLGGCKTAVTARSRIGWMKFRECSEILKGRRFSLKMKEKIYKSCVRSAMLYGSEAWCLREKGMAILRRTERAMIRAMCGVTLLDRRNSEELMDMLGIT